MKIGMVSSAALIEKIAEKLKEYQAENIVVDPVMVATSGAKLIQEDAIEALKTYLLPMATVLTPNIPEAEILSGMKIEEEEAMIEAAKKISENYHCAVLCKGGHQLNDANDLLYSEGEFHWFYGKRIDNPIPTVQDVPYQAPLLRIWRRLRVGDFCGAGKRLHFWSPWRDAQSWRRKRPMNHGFDLKSDFIEKCGNSQQTCENVLQRDKEV